MSESTTSDIQSGARLPRWLWISLGVLTLLTYTVGLNFPLVGPDEPRYAQVAREMLERGDWITPTLGGHTWFEKPALLYWLEVVSYRIFGVSEAAARFGPALCGLGTVLALYVIGRTLQNERGCGIGGYLALAGASRLGPDALPARPAVPRPPEAPATPIACFPTASEQGRPGPPACLFPHMMVFSTISVGDL